MEKPHSERKSPICHVQAGHKVHTPLALALLIFSTSVAASWQANTSHSVPKSLPTLEVRLITKSGRLVTDLIVGSLRYQSVTTGVFAAIPKELKTRQDDHQGITAHWGNIALASERPIMEVVARERPENLELTEHSKGQFIVGRLAIKEEF